MEQEPMEVRRQSKRRRSAVSGTTPEAILGDFAPEVRSIAERLRVLVKEVVPEAVEVAYPGWRAVGYRHPRAGYFFAIFPQVESVRLAFEWGVLLRDEWGLLRQGTSRGAQVRYVEFASGAAIPEDALTVLLLEAISVRSR
jgi:hypothetical protein